MHSPIGQTILPRAAARSRSDARGTAFHPLDVVAKPGAKVAGFCRRAQHIARLRSSFDSISHDVNQPLNAAIQTGLGTVFSATPLAILQPRTAIAWQFEPKTVLRAGFGVFSDILPGTIADVVGVNPPYVKTFQGGLLGTVGGTTIAPGVPNSAVDATVAAIR